MNPRYATLSLLIISAVELAGGFGVLAAQSPPSMSVDDAVHLALSNNPNVAAAQSEVEASMERTRSAGAIANPSIEYSPSIVGTGSDAELVVRQPLEINGGRAARAGVAAAEQGEARAAAGVQRAKVVLATRTAYFELVRAREQLSLARDQLDVAQRIDKLTADQVDAGSRPAIDRTQTQIQVTLARQKSILAGARANNAQAALDTLLGRDPIDPIGEVSAALPPMPAIDEASIVTNALSRRPEIAVAEAVADASRRRRNTIRADGEPDVAPQFWAGQGFHETGVGLVVTVPVIDYGSRRDQLKQNAAQTRAAEKRLAATEARVRQEVAQAVEQVQAADSILQTYPQGLLDQSRRLLASSRIGYEEGKTGIVPLIEAERTYRQVRAGYIDAQVDEALARAQLARAAGTDVFFNTRREGPPVRLKSDRSGSMP